jgi:hypothetical protein
MVISALEELKKALRDGVAQRRFVVISQAIANHAIDRNAFCSPAPRGLWHRHALAAFTRTSFANIQTVVSTNGSSFDQSTCHKREGLRVIKVRSPPVPTTHAPAAATVSVRSHRQTSDDGAIVVVLSLDPIHGNG